MKLRHQPAECSSAIEEFLPQASSASLKFLMAPESLRTGQDAASHDGEGHPAFSSA
jgi:hypothetical protein